MHAYKYVGGLKQRVILIGPMHTNSTEGRSKRGCLL